MDDRTLTYSDFPCAVRNHRCVADAVTQLARLDSESSPESAIRVENGPKRVPSGLRSEGLTFPFSAEDR
jgi:hypothetical protein